MQEKQLEDLKHIRHMMERSTRFISLSGMSGVVAGFIALLGATAQYVFMTERWYYKYYLSVDARYVTFTLINFALVFILSVSAALYFTHRKAKKNNQTLWDSSSRRLAVNILIPLAAGGIFCLILLKHNQPMLVAPATLIFYGLALLNGSNFTLRDIRSLGVLEILLGLTAAWFKNYGLYFWALGFGVFHIIYGLWMYYKYDQN